MPSPLCSQRLPVLMQAAPSCSAFLIVPFCLCLPPCTRASSLMPRTLDERPGFPLSQEIGFISPAHFGCPQRATPGMKLGPLVTRFPLRLPLLPTSPLPFTEHPLGARHFMQMLLACPHHKPMRQGFLSSFLPVEKGVYVPKVTPALVLRLWPYHTYTPALLAHWAQWVGLAQRPRQLVSRER